MTDDNAPAAAALDFDTVPALATSLGLARSSIAAVIALLDEGNTVPFIARYRKERTGGLDEVQIRAIEEQRTYLVELETRRAAILASVGEQGKLTPELEAKLRAASGKSELEDLYAPYRPRRKTRASVAREKGLEPLAQRILAQAGDGEPAGEAQAFVREGVDSADDALAGARDIVAELIADTAEVRAYVRREFAEHGELRSAMVPGKGDEPTKFEQYYQFGEAVKTIPSHRFLAIRRGEAEGVLRAQVVVDSAKVTAGIERLGKLDAGSPWAEQMRLAIADAFKRLLSPSVENDVRAELKQRSDGAAVDIFAGNLRNLLLAAPLGSASVIGVDPGLRTGCKCAAVDATGKFLGTVTVYITQGDAQLAKAKEDFLAFVKLFKPHAIAVGNGTGGREAEAFVKRALADGGMRSAKPAELAPEATVEAAAPPDVAADATAEATTEATPAPTAEAPSEPTGATPAPFVVQVNEAGASVYSASDLAREEFPELDLTIRGAISIARRLQDPLAELVKIEPKSIGVGQYQHDVHQPLLSKKLGDVIEDCVNKIGVELNTASAMLLGYVAGIGKSLAKKIVVHRDTNGAFAARTQLMEISGLGPKAFEQAAGFLRIAGAAHPLDRSSVHPERYPLVEKIAGDLGVELPQLIGNQELVDKIDFTKYVTDEVGEPTLRDIAAELAKPGRDPREEFAPPRFRDDVTEMSDLKPGMVLEGIVTNVTAFGAFVDIGVHNDGLVHVSQLAEQFVKDPSEVVKVGQKLTVRVLEVDNQRKRIALSAKKPQQQQQRQPRNDGPRNDGPRNDGPRNEGQQRGPNDRGGRGRGRGRGPQTQMAGDGSQDPAQQGQAPQGQGPQGQGQGPNPNQNRNEQRPRGPRGGGGGGGGRGPVYYGEARQQQGAGSQQAGSQQAGSQQAGPQGGSQSPDQPRNDRGPQQGGDRGYQGGDRGHQGGDRAPQGGERRQWNDRASSQQADFRGPQGAPPEGQAPNQNQGPGPARRDDRGPRPPQGDQRGAGPRRDDRGGPRRDDRGAPQRDDRGPRNDRGGPPRGVDRPPEQSRPEKPSENWGVAGFKNSPFAKLIADKDGPKRS